MIDVAYSAYVTHGRGAARDFYQLIKASEIGRLPVVVRAAAVPDVGSNDAVSSSFKLIGDMRSNKPRGAGNNDLLHTCGEESC